MHRISHRGSASGRGGTHTMLTPQVRPKAHMLFAVADTLPFRGSLGVVNSYMRRALVTLGYEVTAFHRDVVPRVSHSETLIPLADAARICRLASTATPRLTLYDDHGLAIQVPQRRPGGRIALFHHGLRGSPSIFLASDVIDRYVCNSPYLASVLKSLMRLPLWETNTTLLPRGPARVDHVRLPVPLLDYPDGYPGAGQDLPDEVAQALDFGRLVGHSVQRDKGDPRAMLAIMRALTALAGDYGLGPPRLVIDAAAVSTIDGALRELPGAGSRLLTDLFIPVPPLKNTALVTLMRGSAFGLCYNRVPESFGLYALESVLCGCPIYTNGSGNTRHVLPPGHGIVVHETETMALQTARAEFQQVASAILARHVSGVAASEVRKGREVIVAEYTARNFTEDLGHALARLDETPAALGLDDLRLAPSPLVRSWNPDSTAVLSDHRSCVLGEKLNRTLARHLGARASDLRAAGSAAWAEMEELFELGVLCLVPMTD